MGKRKNLFNSCRAPLATIRPGGVVGCRTRWVLSFGATRTGSDGLLDPYAWFLVIGSWHAIQYPTCKSVAKGRSLTRSGSDLVPGGLVPGGASGRWRRPCRVGVSVRYWLLRANSSGYICGRGAKASHAGDGIKGIGSECCLQGRRPWKRRAYEPPGARRCRAEGG